VSPAGGWSSSGAGAWSNGTNVLELQYHGLSSNTLLSIGPTATVKSGFVYAPYGDVIQTTGTAIAAQHRRFNDKFQDDLTKLSYYGIRYYDPLSLNWTQADPMHRFTPDAAWAEPRRANLYQFDLGSPVRYIDPDGRDAKSVMNYVNNSMKDSLIQTSMLGEMYSELKPFDDAIHGTRTLGGAFEKFATDRYQMAMAVAPAESPLLAGALGIAAARNDGEAGCAIMAGSLGGLTRGGSGIPGASAEAEAEVQSTSQALYPTPQSIGAVGEAELAKLGGTPQARLPTSLGDRVVDQLVGGVGHESKVGRASLTSLTRSQIAKDLELIKSGQLKGAVWHFFRSPVTNKIGPTNPLASALKKAGISWIIH
jgi:RHS repeat-associated protein